MTADRRLGLVVPADDETLVSFFLRDCEWQHIQYGCASADQRQTDGLNGRCFGQPACLRRRLKFNIETDFAAAHRARRVNVVPHHICRLHARTHAWLVRFAA
jgi:hypothetical protein